MHCNCNDLFEHEGFKKAKHTVTLDRGFYTTCTVNLHGAAVVSWRYRNQEQLFVSRRAIFDGKIPIRGGIPFVFPRFGTWSFGPQHGFARIVRWVVEKDPEILKSGDVEAIFSTTDNDFTRSMWNYQFKLTYHLILKERELHFNITLYNTSNYLPFRCHMLLHTYFKVPDVKQCEIIGLQGCTFIDKTADEFPRYLEEREAIQVHDVIDRIYLDTPKEHQITNAIAERTITIEKDNFPDTVIWNPWSEGSKTIADLGDDEYHKMICVEVGHVTKPIILLPCATFEAKQILKLSRDITCPLLYPSCI